MALAVDSYSRDQVEVAIDHWRREVGVAGAISRVEACLVCAGPNGPMVSCGFGTLGQVFRHAECELATTGAAR
jgi:hypothetical protein